MARLPHPGGDSGNWGSILNDYLSQVHASDGTLKTDSVTSDAIAPNAVTSAAIAPATITVEALAPNTIDDTVIADGSITNALIADGTIEEAKLATAVQTKLNQTAPVTSVASKTGDVTLTKTDVGLAQVDNTSDATKNSATATLTNKTLDSPAMTGTTKIAQSGLLELYNTSDQTTNYERGVLYWLGSSTFVIGTQKGGSGTARNLLLSAGGPSLQLNATVGSSGALALSAGTSTANSVGMQITGTLSASSGTQSSLIVNNIINQSSTAGYTMLLVNPTETATGSGSKLLIDAQVGGVSKFSVDNTGLVSGRFATVNDTNGNTSLSLTAAASAIQYVTINNAASGNFPSIAAGGTGNMDLLVQGKGSTGGVQLGSTTNGTGLKVNAAVSSVNYVSISGNATTVAPTISALGTDTNVSLNLIPKGTGTVQANGVDVVTTSGTQTLTNKTLTNPAMNQIYNTSGGRVVTFGGPASPSNYFQLAYNGIHPALSSLGTDTNINLYLYSKGTGTVQANGVDVVTTSGTQTLTNKTLTSPKIGTSILDTNGNTIMSLTPTASAVVYLDVKNQSGGGAGTGPYLLPVGPNANHSLYIQAKGNNSIWSYVALGNTGYHSFKVMNTVTAGGNLLAAVPANAGGTPALTSAYSYSPDTDVSLDLQTKGAGVVKANGNPVVTAVSVPATATSTGTAGQIAYDVNYVYVCTATDTWMRAPIATW